MTKVMTSPIIASYWDVNPAIRTPRVLARMKASGDTMGERTACVLAADARVFVVVGASESGFFEACALLWWFLSTIDS